MAKKFEELTISDDFMFCVVMQNSRFCKKFLETILGVKIARIEYPDAQKTINITPDAKSVRLDVYLEDDQDTVYDIEMQNAPKPNPPKRMRYYQGMMDLNLLNKGEDYTELKKSYVIFVCTFDPFMQGRHIYTFENLCKEDTNLALGDDTKKVILNTKGIFNDVSPELKRLLDFIDGKEPQDDFTKELSSEVDVVKQNEKWRRDYMTLQMEYNEKYRQGLEKGIEQGETSAKEAAARRMLADGTLSMEQIADFTGLNLKQVEELKSRSL